MDSAAVLEMELISKNFGSLEILKQVNLRLNAGQSAAILGPSGAGKSTLLHIAGLMERPTSGRVFVLGKDVEQLSENERAHERLDTIGFVFQFHYLLPDFDVLENVLMPSRIAGDDLRMALDYAKQLLVKLGLGERLTHRPNQLSGGEQQRAALARALVRKPKLLLCDEPTGNLDQRTARDVMNLIWNEVTEENVACVLVTHNQDLAREANLSYHLVEGRFIGEKMEAAS